MGGTPLVGASRLGESIGVDGLLIKDDTRNPTLSFKDRAVAIAAARAADVRRSRPWAARARATSPAPPRPPRPPSGVPAYVFVPADLEPAKIEHALAYGATVVRIDGTYDDVNRVCLEVADELPWGLVNVNLRPFYAEGSKTLGYEIAEDLGWRLPDVIVAPDRLGRDGHPPRPRVRGARRARLGRRQDRAVRGRAGGGLRAGRDGVRRRRARTSSRSGRRTRSCARSRSATRPTGATRSSSRGPRPGRSRPIADEATADAIRRTATLEGIYTETAGGVTIAARPRRPDGGA